MRRLELFGCLIRQDLVPFHRLEAGRHSVILPRHAKRVAVMGLLLAAVISLAVASVAAHFGDSSLAIASRSSEAPNGPGAYVLTATWTSNTSTLPPDAWRKVTGIDIAADGRIFIADAGERRITYLDSAGRSHVLVPPGGGTNGIVDTGHLGVDSVGDRLYVADIGVRSVAVFSLDGKRVATWGNLPNIGGLAVTPDGNVVIARNDTGEVMVYSPEGFQLTKFLAVAPAPGGDLVRGVDVDADGRMYVIDRPGRRILVYTAEGRKTDTLTPPVAASAEMIDVAVEFDPRLPGDRQVWLATSIGLFRYDVSADQSYPYRVGGTLPAVAVRKGVGTVTATVDRVGRGSSLWLLPPGAGQITAPQQFGGYITQLGLLDRPERIAIGEDEKAYVLDVPPRLQRYGLDGVALGQVVFTNAMSVPTLADAGPDGSVYATNGTWIMAFDPNNDGRRPPRWQQQVVPPPTGPPIPGQAAEAGHAVGLVFDAATNEVVALEALAGQLRRFAAADGARGAVTTLNVAPTDTPVWTDLAGDAGGTLYAYDRAARQLHVIRRGAPERLVGFAAPSRQMTGGPAGQLFSLERDGWVRRWDVSPGAGANAVRTAAFDASRFDRGASRPTDLAADAQGDVYVVDRAANVVSRYHWDANGTPAEPLEGAVCRASTTKTAGPNQIDLGQSVTVMLTVGGGCGAVVSDDPLDVMLILDRSASMADGNKMNTLREAAMNFVAEVDFSKTNVGVVSFTTQGRVEARLGASATQVRQAIAALQPDLNGGTAIDVGLNVGRDQYNRGRRQGVKGIFILISDGVSNYDAAVAEAAEAKRLGIEIYTVGIQAFAQLMQAVATDREHYFPADSARYLYGIFEDILEKITSPNLFSSLTVRDTLPNNMRLVVGSVAPTSTQQGAALVWTFADVKPGAVTMRLDVTPQQVGCWPTNTMASADYVDGFGNIGQLTFPVPQVCVREPAVGTPTPTDTPVPPTVTPVPTDTQTPTSTNTPLPTPTPTLTPVPKPIYLPIGIREQCKPGEKYADVMLVIDTSNSMVGPPLEAAKEAARLFTGLLALPNDQIGLVAFNTDATLASRLTGDRAALDAVISTLTTQAGTRIDRGLEMAIAELASPRHKPANTPVVVVLTDGVGEETARAVQLAADARTKGTRIYAVGLGSDIDIAVLEQITGSSGRTFVAPVLADLARIYRQVAGQVPCPAESFWGRR